MLMRKGIGAVIAAGAMASLVGLASCADTGPAGTSFAGGYGSGYSGSDYITPGDYGTGYDTLGYGADGVWLGGLYGGGGYGWWGGYDHSRAHGHGSVTIAGTGRVGSAVSHDGWRDGIVHAAASPGGFFGGTNHFGGTHFAGGFGSAHFAGGFGGGHFGGGGGHR